MSEFFKTEIKGAREIANVLDRMPEAIRRRAMNSALRAGGRVIRDEARRLVPVDSGELRDSIATGVASGRRKAPDGEARVLVGPRKPVSKRAHLTEFGTKFAAAKPFLRPAFDTRAGEALRKIGEALGPAVERAAVKLAGPLAKSGLRRR